MKTTLTLLAALLLAAGLVGSVIAQTPKTKINTNVSLNEFVHPPVNFKPGPEYGPEARKYQGIPGIERAPGGRLWAVWYAGKIWEDQYNYVVAATSGDDGKTWSDLKFVIDPDGDGPMRTSDPCFWLDPDGRLWLFWWLNGPGELRTVTMAMTTDNPDAESPQWSAPRVICKGVMLNKPIVMRNGEWLLPTAIWKTDGSCRAMVSADKGTTWSLRGAANVPKDQRDCDEPMLVARRDGSLWQLVRTVFGIAQSVSKDGGRTWTEFTDYLPNATSRFYLSRLASGNFLLVKHGPLDKKIGRSHLTAYLSEDDGATWRGGLVLDERDNVSYPDGTQAPDGTIRVIYDWNRGRDKHILMAVFTEADVLAGKFVSAAARSRVLINQATGINPKIFPHAKPGPDTNGAAPLAALQAAEPVTIDLAKRTWQGIPGLERTAKGRVFVSWFTGGTKEPEPENTVVLSQSDDGGKTFSAPQAMGLPLNDGTRCYDPCLWIDPKGRLWYLFNRSIKDSTQHGVYARICDHPDETPPVFCAEFRVGFDGPFSFRMNKPIALSTGEWVMPVVHALEPVAAWAGFDPKQVQGVGISTDEGKTWTLHGAVRTPGAALENMIVELRDGRLWMLIRTAKVLWESHSSDKGRTWTEGKATTIPTPHSRFFIRRLASGNLLLVNHYKFTGRSHLTAQLSTDDGATWNEGLLLDERGGGTYANGVPGGVSYPDGVQDKDGLIWITYDRGRNSVGEILLAKFREEDVLAGKNVSGAVTLKQVIDKLDMPKLVPTNWDAALAGDAVLKRLVKVTAPQVKGAHDAEFVCVGDRAYVVSEANDLKGGESGDWPFIYSTLSIVNLKTLKTERVIDFAKGEQAFINETLPAGACWVPRIIQKYPDALRCYFVSQDPGKRQSQMWYRDFDLGRNEFAPTIQKAKLKTAAGTFDFQPQHFHADAAALGFKKKASDSFFFVFDSFKKFDGKLYVALNNFTGQQNALALVHDDLATFEVIGHYNEPESAALSESAVNRLPDGTWMAICRNDKGNYHFTTSQDGRTWTIGEPKPFVPNGLNSKPTFDRFGGLYYLGWQEATSIQGANRSVFNVDISRDGKTWERKYRFETPYSFQYPTFHEHEGAIWLCVTQGDTDASRKERIMFGKLETVGDFERQNGQTKRVSWPVSSPPTELPASIRPSPQWIAQAAEDAKRDFTSIPFDGITPNKLACDTTLREMPDGSWVMVMLGGGDTEPRPENHVLLTRSHDKGKTWSPMQPLDFGFPREGDTIAMVPSELMVHSGRCTLFFASHDGKFAGWKEWMTHSEDSCRTWSKPAPAPGRLHDRTFVRNHIVARDGRILLPFQHYLDAPSCRNPRNGVLMSADGGKTWKEYGNIRISKDDKYHGWAENNIVELSDGRIAMIIRADGYTHPELGGVLYYAESKDGGKTWPEFAVKSDIPNPGTKATLYLLGGDTVALLHNPNPKGRHPLALWISFDGMKTWPYQRVLVEHSSDGPGRSLNYPDGFVNKDKQWLHFAYDDNRHRAMHYSAKLPPLPAPKAADAPKPAVKVTQELLNSIHVTPTLIFDPMPTYGQKYLLFAMAASMESTSKGRLWTCWAGGQDGPNAYLLASYSDDQGKSWRDPVFVIDPQAQGLKMGTRLGSFWCDPKGRLWLFFHQSVGMFDGSCSNWYVRCDDPDAEKPVWTEPVYIGFGASINKPIVRKNGEWILPVSLWERWHIDKPFADCYRELDSVRGADVFVSDDEGASWRYRGGNIFKDSCFNEHSVVEKQDGTLWMLSRCMKEIAQSFSSDGGKTWQPQTTFFPHVNSKAVFRRLASGNILLIKHGSDFNEKTKDASEKWNWGQGRSRLSAYLSADDGKTWSGGLLLDERHPVSYPDIAQAPNGDIYVHYDRDRGGAAEILFARFREEDVKAGKLVSKDAALKNLVKSKLGMNHGGEDAATPPKEPNAGRARNPTSSLTK